MKTSGGKAEIKIGRDVYKIEKDSQGMWIKLDEKWTKELVWAIEQIGEEAEH